MVEYTRGKTIHFAATFVDSNGLAYTPDSAMVTIDYPSDALNRAFVSVALTNVGGEWVTDWDSGIAGRSGRVFWTIYSASPAPKIAEDGYFDLQANTSNLVAV